MLVLDDVLFSPVKGLFWIFREIQNVARQEVENESENITNKLSELYMMLETGKISEAEFEAEEKVLLDRLDEIEAGRSDVANDIGLDEDQ